MTKQLDTLIEGILEPYKQRVPQLTYITNLMKEHALIQDLNEIENDHFAFRTLGLPALGIESLAPLFTHYGYFRRDFLHFKEKKLDAYWFAPPTEHYPRIFISELKVDQLSENAQTLIKKYTKNIEKNPVNTLDLFDIDSLLKYLSTPQWSLPTHEDYTTLLEESEYAAWVMINQNNLNHFTISVHSLPEPYDSLSHFNTFLEEHAIHLNEAGGKIKISPDKKLLQSSTVAPLINFTLPDGEYPLPSSYIEFAERKPLTNYEHLPKSELKRQHRREGFEAANADKIFESTYSSQTDK